MANNPYWNGKIVLVTGGSSGIGLAAAKQLAAAGAHVWLAARQREKLEAALKEVLAARVDSQKCGIVPADVSDSKQAAQLVDIVTHSVGAPDVLFNSAGITQPGYVQELPLSIFEQLMRVNYFGTVYTTAAVLPAMLKRGSGHIINISSMAGFLGGFGYTAYGASKYAVAGYSEALRAEMKSHGIRVSVVFPPDTATPQLEYEEPYKPAETKAVAGTAKAFPAEKVAHSIVQEAGKGRYMIFPAADTRFWYLVVTKLPKGLVFYILDRIAASAKKSTSTPPPASVP